MARAVYYPAADRDAQWYGNRYSGVPIEPNNHVWHTTESGGWPSYGRGRAAPHLTYHCEARRWRQHFRLDRSARALRNPPGGVETNTLNCSQVELICYSDEGLARSRGHLPVSQLSAANLRDLGEFSAFMWNEWGLRLEIDEGWEFGGDRSPERMSDSEWRNFYGHTGHNRVPENTHWDPGRLDIHTIIGNARGDDVGYKEVWRTDKVMRAPRGRETAENKHWWPESILEHIGDFAAGRHFRSPYIREEIREGRGATSRWLLEWTWHFAHGSRTNAHQAEVAAKANGRQIASLAGQLSGLSEAVAQLAASHDRPVDLDAIRAAAMDGTEQALGTFDITVTLSPGEEGEPVSEEDAGA